MLKPGEEELKFDVVKEPWNEYQLPDGSLLRVKHVLLRIVKRVKPDGKISYSFDEQNISVISHVPPESRGTPYETVPK